MGDKCPKCQSENPEDSSFCSKCGSQLIGAGEKPDLTKTIQKPSQELSPGTTLADQYEIIEELGRGGMGVVYRAKDRKLGREVAIKVLPQEFSQDWERLARFEREAKLLASLNHPNIAAIYGLEKSEGRDFLVLELAEGKTLAERIVTRSLETQETLKICHQIAEALEAAHEKGIIHRDLKPANIKVTSDGKVKVLDFGLAKAFETAASGEAQGVDLSKSPTITVESSRSGVILGTAAYMSPEQARGRPLDKRTDIWSFGCVLFEALTGEKAYTGDTISDSIAAILKCEPDWKAIPETTPLKLRNLLRRCLQKDPHNRLHDIADARIELQDVLSGPPEEIAPVARPTPLWRILSWATVGLALVLIFILLWSPWRTSQYLQQPTGQFVNILPQGETLYTPGVQSGAGGSAVAVSDDGTKIAYVGRRGDTRRLFLRLMHQLEAKAIPGTEGAEGPFFSPDGNWVGFFAEGKLKKVSLRGGAPQEICDALPGGGCWGLDETIVYGNFLTGMWRVPIAGGIPEPLAAPFQLFKDKPEQHLLWPQILPGGEWVLFTSSHLPENAHIEVLSLESGERRSLIERGTQAKYLPTGHIVYAWGGDLLAVPFNLKRLEVTGSPFPVLEGVKTEFSEAHFDISQNGTLVYVPGQVLLEPFEVAWVDLEGKTESLPLPPGNYIMPRLSPDGRQLVVTKIEERANQWICDLERGTMRRLTDEEGDEFWSIWAPDSKRIVFNSNRHGGPSLNLYIKRADGSGPEERLAESEFSQIPQTFSPDGKSVIYHIMNPTNGLDIWTIPLEGERTPEPLINSKFNECTPIFSPDGRWLAYSSDLSGPFEVFIRPYPGPGETKPISTEGGIQPLWSPDGRRLYYRDLSGSRVMSVSFSSDPELIIGQPELLFQGEYSSVLRFGRGYDLALNGSRFLMMKTLPLPPASTQFNIITNWFEELKRLIPKGKN
jgi:serine/threonine protein kinase